MTYTKVTVIILAVLTFFSALIAIVSLGLMSEEDYAVQEQVAYTSFKEPESYDPEIFAYDANRGELRKEYFGIKLADLKQDENGNFIMSEQQRETFIKNILGKHMCSLQWISWKDFGTVTISQDSGKTIHVKGGQKSKTNSDNLEIDGTLSVVNPLHLQFTGQIITCVDHINNGNPVKRMGTYNFTVAGQRRYWRMQEMTNPDDPCCDYVDIYFD